MSKTTAELLVQEDQYKGQFEIKTYFSGGISIRLFKDNLELVTIDLDDLDQILTIDRGFKKDKKGIYRLTRGECKASFGIEQKIELHQRPLNPHESITNNSCISSNSSTTSGGGSGGSSNQQLSPPSYKSSTGSSSSHNVPSLN